MKDILAAELKSVDKVTENAQIDKKAAYRSVLKTWAESNSLVKRAIKGEINISDECKSIFQKLYGKGKNFYPNFISEGDQTLYINREGQEIILNELEEIIGEFVRNNYSNIVRNPVTGTVVPGGLVYCGGKVAPKKEKFMTRRTLLKFVTGVVVAAGGLTGASVSSRELMNQRHIQRQAEYIQSIITEAYKL